MTPSDSNKKSLHSDATEKGLAGAEYQYDEILGGRYRVISLLGKGGMGVVYRVEQIFLGKELALKTIDRQFMSDITVRRFKAEARAAFAVDHPNIIAVHDFGVFEDETPFLVMEIVEGETLGDRLKRGPLTIDEAVPIFVQTCFGLAHAHDCGVIHRDIKPNNIMLLNKVPDGIDIGVKILDFGIAKLAHEGGEMQALTRTGEIFGSPFYMSPEQCSGARVDHRSDIYSLGCVIFESLTGKPPFVGENALTTMMLHQTGSIPTLKQATKGGVFPPGLEELVATMLAKNPNDRYQSLGAAALDLGAFKRGAPLELSAALKSKRPGDTDKPKGIVTFERRNFYGALLGLGFLTFTVSSLLTYFTQVANFQSPTSISVETSQSAATGTGTGSATATTTATNVNSSPPHATTDSTSNSKATALTTQQSNTSDSQPGTQPASSEQPSEPVNEESIIFKNDIAHGANSFKSGIATDLSLKAFKNYKLAQVVLLQNGEFTDSGLENLKDSKLLTLGLSNCIIKKLDNIDKLAWLQTMDLTNTEINDTAMPVLARMKMLHVLTLTGCNISEDGLRQLSKSNSLTFVFLTPHKYSDRFISELSEKMPACVFVPYMKNSRLHNIGESEKSKVRMAVLSKLIAVAEKANPNHSSVGTMLLEVGLLKTQQGQFKEARALIDKTVALFERNGDKQMLTVPLTMQANYVAKVDKQPQKAIEMLNRAEQIFVDCCIHNSNKPTLMTLNEMTLLPISLRIFDPAITYCKTALSFIEKYPSADGKEMLPVFLEKIGWLYFAEKQLDQSRPYLKQAIDLTIAQRQTDPKPYLRVVIEYAHTLGDDIKARKSLYIEGITGLEKLGLPEELNLKEHYCDACASVASIFAAEGDHNESAKYLVKGLDAIRHFKHQDLPARRVAFSKALVGELKAAGRTDEAKKVAKEYGVQS